MVRAGVLARLVTRKEISRLERRRRLLLAEANLALGVPGPDGIKRRRRAEDLLEDLRLYHWKEGTNVRQGDEG